LTISDKNDGKGEALSRDMNFCKPYFIWHLEQAFLSTSLALYNVANKSPFKISGFFEGRKVTPFSDSVVE